MGLVCNMCVRIQGNVRKAISFADEETVPGKVSFHYGQRGSSARHSVGDLGAAR